MTFRRITTEHCATYDSEADAAYVRLAARIQAGAAVRQEVVTIEGSGDVILDFDKDNRLLGVEIVGAAALLPDLLLHRLGVLE